MSKKTGIIIHCSDSTYGSRNVLHQWHVVENGWDDVGYHFGILNGHIKPGLFLSSMDGQIETYRDITASGAHAKGYNDTHIGIVLIGTTVFSEKQKIALRTLITDLCLRLGIGYDDVLGHCEVSSKSCPNFDVKRLIEDLKTV